MLTSLNSRLAVRMASVLHHSWLPRAMCTNSNNNGALVTHTGQQYEDGDYRWARFVEHTKEVNPNFAIDLIAQVPPQECTERVVSCDGGGGALGHPKVFINLDQPGNHSCGYCGLRFFKKSH